VGRRPIPQGRVGALPAAGAVGETPMIWAPARSASESVRAPGSRPRAGQTSPHRAAALRRTAPGNEPGVQVRARCDAHPKARRLRRTTSCVRSDPRAVGLASVGWWIDCPAELVRRLRHQSG
jgi:hypothetical protein